MTIEKYKKEDLAPLIAEGTKDKTPDAWVVAMFDGIKRILSLVPSRYRAYGPYWYPLKNEFIKRGDLSFGEFTDAEWLAEMDYGDTKLNIAAAFAYEETQFNLGLVADAFHTLEDADGNPVEYVSADPDMERA